MVSTWKTCFLPLVVIPQKILTGYFKDGVSFIPEVEYLFEKKVLEKQCHILCFFYFDKTFHLVLVSIGLKQEKIQLIVG